MLNVGLTGGIGAGKSAVAARLVADGAVLIDSDVLAREVVQPGTPGLEQVLAAFGGGVRRADGSLDRPALARTVFADASARARLEAIVHPLVRARSAELSAAAAADAVIVHDIPLLAEVGWAPRFDLVVVVTAPRDVRLARLERRGLPTAQAEARIAAQAPDAVRAAVADVVIDNSGSLDELHRAVDDLWRDRLVPFESNKRLHRVVTCPPVVPLRDHDPNWPGRFRRLAARLHHLLGDAVDGIEHIGSTAVPGLVAKDVLDVQIAVPNLAVADDFAETLTQAGFPRRDGVWRDNPKPFEPDPERWDKRLHGGTDPARVCHLHVRATGSPGWRYALALRDYLRADDAARRAYAALKRRLVVADGRTADYVAAKEPWFDEIWPQVERWIAATGWQGPCPATQPHG